MEHIGQGYGFTLYSTTIKGSMMNLPLKYDCLHDRAVIYINGEKQVSIALLGICRFT